MLATSSDDIGWEIIVIVQNHTNGDFEYQKSCQQRHSALQCSRRYILHGTSTPEPGSRQSGDGDQSPPGIISWAEEKIHRLPADLALPLACEASINFVGGLAYIESRNY